MRAAMMESPTFSKRAYTSPMRLPLTPSGLTMDRVRSSAIRWILSGSAGQPTSLLGRRPCGNARGAGSAGLVRLFLGGGAAEAAGRLRASDREALAAAALALHVGVAEAKCLVEALLHEVDDGAVEEIEAPGIHEHPHAAVLEHCVAGLLRLGIVYDVGKPRAAGLADAQAQSDTRAPGREKALDAVSRGFSQRDSHQSSIFYRLVPLQ